MVNVNFYIATCDKSSYILRPYAWCFDKYIPERNINILGYSVFPELPARFNCVSLADKQNKITEWCTNLYNYFYTVKDEYVIFGLDDFFVTGPIDYDILKMGHSIMCANRNIGRYELGTGHFWHTDKPVIYSGRGYDFYKYGFESDYRISTQYSLWRRDYLLKYLNNQWSPFDFERHGSKLAKYDGHDIIATDGNHAMSWVICGAISGRHPGQINVDGLKREDVEEMISLGLLDRSKLQIGMAVGHNPKYI